MRVRRSLASRILLPVLLLAAVTIGGVLLIVDEVTRKVREDYERFTLDSGSAQVTALLELAASELTAAKLSGNSLVVEVKQRAVREALVGFWTGAGLDGLVLGGDGAVLASTLGEEETAAVVAAARRDDELFVAGGLRCEGDHFPAWGWTVITAARRAPLSKLRPELARLLPALALLAAALAAAVLAVLWRNLRTPVARMAADVDADCDVRPTGMEELDRIGAAVNSAVARLRVRSTELAEELERRRAAERSLQEKEARIRLLLQSTAEGIFGVDTRGVCTFCNPAALRLLGHSREEDLLGKSIHQLVHASRPDGSAYPEADCPVRRTCVSGAGMRVADEVFWRKDGASFPVEYWSYPVIEEGALVGAVVGFIDISDRAALEEQLRQAQKMEAVGRLAGGIAHDFNNMLMAIQGHATLARELAEEGSPVQHDLDQVLAATEKAAGLTRQILAFSRKRPMTLAPVDMNDVVLGMGKVLTRLLGEDVEVVYRLGGGGLVVMADRAQVEQVLLNLWTNARDAMPQGGRLTIGTQVLAYEGDAAAALGLEGAGRYVVVTVTDSGLGMDEQTRRRIFEPFFTTKEHGKGTGLGLSIVYGIVKQHRGQIAAASAPGLGTTFRIFLPLADGAAARPAPAVEPPVRGGSETVLLAEDNEEVRALVRSVLGTAGYRVLVARDGGEAVALHEAHSDEIALCLFDAVMPRLGGREALERIRARRPCGRALLMSGYVPDQAEGSGATADVALLTKPIVPRELLRKVREALDA